MRQPCPHSSLRLLPTTAWLAAIVCCNPGPVVAAEFATGLSPCKSTFATPGAETPSQIAALDLLGSVTQLGSAHGRAVLSSNLERTVAINNHASPAVRAQALVDAQITDTNAYTLADGLGATLADIYRRKARFESDDDGVTKRCGEVAPAVSAVIALVNGLSGGDSNAGKLGFANGLHGAYSPPPEGSYDVLGKAYGHPAGTAGAGKYGNARPFQTAPLDAKSGPRIATYDAMDFYGLTLNTRAVLAGDTEAEKAAGINGSDLGNSPSFPSGHTTFGYTESLTLAMMVPERFQALAYRGSEYGNSRIALGAHYALDVIAGRTLATYDLAQDLAGRPHYAGDGSGSSFRAVLASAAADLRGFLRQNGCPSIALCARDPIARARDAVVWAGGEQHLASPQEAYAFRLNYGLAPIGATDRPPEPVPEEAGYLLQSRFPYLTPDQRREVLRTTEGPSGYFLDASPLDGTPLAAVGKGPAAEAGVYSRLDLFAAAGGYASLAEQVIVDQDHITDPSLAPFDDLARFDVWTNDIGGPGGLTKRGGGTLRLTGHNTFKGPAVVEKGTLEIAGSLAADARVDGGNLAGTGTVGNVAVAAGGSLTPGSVDGGGALTLAGSLTLAKGSALTLRPYIDSPTPLTRVEGHASLDGARLIVFARRAMPPGTRLTVLEAKGGISGTFADVVLDTSAVRAKVSYDANAVYLTTEAVTEPKMQP